MSPMDGDGIVGRPRSWTLSDDGSPLSTGPPTLASVLGAVGLPEGPLSPGAASAAAGQAFTHVLKVVEALQGLLQENESMISESQAKLGDLDEKCRTSTRRAERADHEREESRRKRDEAQQAAERLRSTIAPLVERYMEAEVLREQLQASTLEAARLREETAQCHVDIARGWPKLSEAEDDENGVAEAIAELEGATSTEASEEHARHHEELGEHRSRHVAQSAGLEAARDGECASVRAAHAEETARLTSSVEAAKWETDVFAREAQDAVREISIRQRENARLAKRHGQARQDCIELAVKLEALGAAEQGLPGREAELRAVWHRRELLRRTHAEWLQELELKTADSTTWQRRAVQSGAATASEVEAAARKAQDEDEEEDEDNDPVAPDTPASAVPGDCGLGGLEVSGLSFACSASSTPALGRQFARPSRTPPLAPPPLPSRLGTHRHHGEMESTQHDSELARDRRRHAYNNQGYGDVATAQPLNAWREDSSAFSDDGSRGSGSQSGGEGSVALLSNGYADGGDQEHHYREYGYREHDVHEHGFREHGRTHLGYPEHGYPESGYPDGAYAEDSFREDISQDDAEDAYGSPQDAHWPVSGPAGPAEEFVSAVLREAELWATSAPEADMVDAEQELEMLSFLLTDGDAERAAALLALEERRRPPAVAQRLRVHLDDLAARWTGRA